MKLLLFNLFNLYKIVYFIPIYRDINTSFKKRAEHAYICNCQMFELFQLILLCCT